MIAVALLVAAASGPAQEAFARGDYAAAESLAAQAGDSYLEGLALFRLGRSAEALSAFDRAAVSNDPLWHFNRAACLYELQRFGEAETEYLAAAADASVSAVALVNAGFAALDGGAPDRARGLAARVRAAGAGNAADLLADLEAHLGADKAAALYREGMEAFDSGRFADAREHFQQAVALDPADGKSRIMAGAAALQLGDRGEARSSFQTALGMKLDERDARTARDYLDTLARGLPARGRGWEGSLRLGAGIDTDADQTGLSEPVERPGLQTSQLASAAATTDLLLAFRAQREKLSGEVSYGFSQIAYLSTDARDYSLQQHGISGALEFAARDDLRVGFSGSVLAAFTGWSQFAGLEAAVKAGGWLAYDESEAWTTRLDLEYTRKNGLSNYSYLTGNRADAALSQELRLGRIALDAGYQFRLEDIGTETHLAPPPVGAPGCFEGCSALFVVPFAYTSNSLWLSGRGAFGQLTLDLSGGVELRDYLHDNYLLLDDSLVVDARRRHDTRIFASAQGTWRLWRNLSLSLRYDAVLSSSNIESNSPDQHHHFDPADQSYTKQLITFGTLLNF